MAAAPRRTGRARRAIWIRGALAAASVLITAAVLTACLPEGARQPTLSPGTQQPTREPTPIETHHGATPTPTDAAVEIPTDCREILNAAILAEFGPVPLNDPAFGPSGVQPDGSLICVWGDPRADTTGLVTTIERVPRGEALAVLNELVQEEDFTCYTPDEGTRCEKTWQNAQYPVTDGRTLFWRDDILIDTRFSNLAPSGYTSAIIASIWG